MPHLIFIITLGSQAFRQCSAISKIMLVNGLAVLGDQMFQMWNGISTTSPTLLGSITVPSSVTFIGKNFITIMSNM